jgi:hypothetical protein
VSLEELVAAGALELFDESSELLVDDEELGVVVEAEPAPMAPVLPLVLPAAVLPCNCEFCAPMPSRFAVALSEEGLLSLPVAARTPVFGTLKSLAAGVPEPPPAELPGEPVWAKAVPAIRAALARRMVAFIWEGLLGVVR